jgi:uncharacterized membrane protein YdjX (TVP38/TMEM64 family)
MSSRADDELACERSPSRRARAARRLGLLAAAVGLAFAVVALTVPHSAGLLRDAFTGLGVVAPFAFVAAATVLTCALFPYPLIAAASGLVFGTALGTMVSIAAGTTGALAAFLIARAGGADAVAELAGPRLRRLLAAVGRRGFVAVLYLRIVPGVPRDVANYATGLTAVRVLPYTLATLLGIAPRAFAYSALGSSFRVTELTSREAIVAVAVLAAMALLGLGLIALELHRGRAE